MQETCKTSTTSRPKGFNSVEPRQFEVSRETKKYFELAGTSNYPSSNYRGPTVLSIYRGIYTASFASIFGLTHMKTLATLLGRLFWDRGWMFLTSALDIAKRFF